MDRPDGLMVFGYVGITILLFWLTLVWCEASTDKPWYRVIPFGLWIAPCLLKLWLWIVLT